MAVGRCVGGGVVIALATLGAFAALASHATGGAFATLASLASGGLMNCSGGDVVSGWTAVNLAIAPFLFVAGGALIWLALVSPRPRRTD